MIDYSFDALVHPAAVPNRGVWANHLSYGGVSPERNAGQAPLEASRHTLLAIATISALKSISRGQTNRLARLQQLILIPL